MGAGRAGGLGGRGIQLPRRSDLRDSCRVDFGDAAAAFWPALRCLFLCVCVCAQVPRNNLATKRRLQRGEFLFLGVDAGIFFFVCVCVSVDVEERQVFPSSPSVSCCVKMLFPETPEKVFSFHTLQTNITSGCASCKWGDCVVWGHTGDPDSVSPSKLTVLLVEELLEC